MKKLFLVIIITINIAACKDTGHSNTKSNVFNNALADGYNARIKSVTTKTYFRADKIFDEWVPDQNSLFSTSIEAYDINGLITHFNSVSFFDNDTNVVNRSCAYSNYDGYTHVTEYDSVMSRSYTRKITQINDSTWKFIISDHYGIVLCEEQAIINRHGRVSERETVNYAHLEGEAEAAMQSHYKHIFSYDAEGHIIQLTKDNILDNTSNTYSIETAEIDKHGNPGKIISHSVKRSDHHSIELKEFTYYE